MMFSSGARLGVYEILAPLGKGGMGRVGGRLGRASGPSDLYLLPAPGANADDRKRRAFLQASASEHSGEFSPDGRWIACVSEESVPPEVYVRPAGAGGGKWQVSTDGGTLPRWAGNGRELFFRSRGRIMGVAIEPSVTFRVAPPKVLFPQISEFTTAYDVSPDAKRFRMVHSGGNLASTAAPQAHIVLEWFEDIRRRVW